MSKNAVTIEQLATACRHVDELINAGMTENLAIRNLEQFANFYAKMRIIGNTAPDHVDQYKLWSKAARTARSATPDRPSGQHLRIEHGTPRRHFARYVLETFKAGNLTKEWMDHLCDTKWKVAVITHEEDQQLNTSARSQLFDTPEKRWASAGIKF
jgi:hypothetical protein